MKQENKTTALTFAITATKVISKTEVHVTLDGHLDAEGAPVLSDALGQQLENGVRNVTMTSSVCNSSAVPELAH
jgi:hypothetical protein